MAAFIVVGHAEDNNGATYFQYNAKILGSLRDLNAANCDAGVAYAVNRISSISDKKESRVESVRGLLRAAGIYGQDQAEMNKKRSRKVGSIQDEFDSMLPPRVALEHPNEELRLDAIAKLTSEAKEKNDGDDIATALLRRYCSDDNASVVSSSVDALVELSIGGCLSELFMLQNVTASDVTKGFQRAVKAAGMISSEVGKKACTIEDKESRVLISSLKFVGMVAKALKDNLDFEVQDMEDDKYSESIYSHYERLVRGLVSLKCVCDGAKSGNFSLIEKEVVEALAVALSSGTKQSKSKTTLMRNIVKGAAFKALLQRSISSLASDETVCISETEHFIWFFIRYTNAIPVKDCDANLIEHIVDACLLTLDRYEKKLKKSEEFTSNIEILTSNLSKCVKVLLSEGDVHEIVKVISDISTIGSDMAYEEVGVKILNTISKSNSVLYPYLLMEIVSRPNLAVVGIERILNSINTFVDALSGKNRESVFKGVLVCMLALCCNPNLKVRESALGLITKVASTLRDNDAVGASFGFITSIAGAADSPMRTNIIMDGSNALPKLLSSSLQQNNARAILRPLLLETCADLVRRMSPRQNYSIADEGIYRAVIVMLQAMESAGEKAFSLSDRWCFAGMPIFQHLLAFPPAQKSETSENLIECVVLMLKGISVEEDAVEDSIVISTGPTVSGRRRRAYSIGMANGVSFIDPYPKEMKNTLITFLSLAVEKPEDPFIRQLCEALNRLVLCRSSWANGIFTKLESKTRDVIAKSLLKLRSESGMESAGLALIGLPLPCEHFLEALSSKSSRASKSDSGGLLALTALMDCIRAQAQTLKSEKAVFKLLLVIYSKLSSISYEKATCHGSDYARTCIIHALLALSENTGDLKQLSKNANGNNKLLLEIGSQSKLLVCLLGEGGEAVKPLISSRSRSLCLQLLTCLCALSPSSVVDSLVPAMINSISNNDASSNLTKDALMAIVPAYCVHALSAGHSLFTLLQAFAKKCTEEDISFEQKLQLFTYLNDALESASRDCGVGEALSTVVTMFIASEASSKHIGANSIGYDHDHNPISFVQELLSNIDPKVQIAGTLEMLRNAGKLLPCLQMNRVETMEGHSSFFILETTDICNLAINGPLNAASSATEFPYELPEKLPIMRCITMLLSVVEHIYATISVKRLIRDGDDSQTGVCLTIWQELLTLQSTTTHARYEKVTADKETTTGDKFWESLGDKSSGILSSLQNLLPAVHFLSSVSTLMKDSDVEVDIQRRALLLFAERCTETDPTSHEAVLFLEMIPDLVSMTVVKAKKYENFDSHRDSSIITQASFKAIDQLSKSFGLSVSDEKLQRKRTKEFMPALQATSAYLQSVANLFEIPDVNETNEPKVSAYNLDTQVFSSAALCAASLITLLKAKCLTMLPKLVKSLLKILSTVNSKGSNIISDDGEQDSLIQSMKSIQLSALRALVAVADHIPQFLPPYIAGILTVHGLPSQFLRNTESEEELAVSSMADRLERAIASGVAARQLIPILSKSTATCLTTNSQGVKIWKESLVVFKILKLSIEKATRKDLGPMAGKILSSLVQAYAFDCDELTRTELISVANDTLLAMVMKLSEAQLRLLYAKLREWRGDIDTSQSDEASTRRRISFWSLSAAISRELRSIFLPCMSTVVCDIVKELVSISVTTCSNR